MDADRKIASLPERPRPGEVIDGLEVLALLAGGGMGEVYLGRRRRAGGFEKHLALKVMHPHLAVDGALVAMFLDEARIAAQVCHPNVVEVLDTGVHRGLPWIAMELVGGPSLAETIAARPPRALLAAVLAGAAAGLHAAHETSDGGGRSRAIVHRDVSPDNVLIGLDGVAKVVDFGIASASGRLAHTATGELKGKVGYLAPEQLGRRGEPVTRAVDVWAFGVVAWQAMRGERLFDADDVSRRLRQVESMPIPPLDGTALGISEALTREISRCLERDPAARAPTLEPIARALGEDAARGGFGTVEDVARWARAHRAPRLAVAIDAGGTERDVAPADVVAKSAAAAGAPVISEAVEDSSVARTREQLGAARRVRAGAVTAVVVAIAIGASWLANVTPARPAPGSPSATTSTSAAATSATSPSTTEPTAEITPAPIALGPTPPIHTLPQHVATEASLELAPRGVGERDRAASETLMERPRRARDRDRGPAIAPEPAIAAATPTPVPVADEPSARRRPLEPPALMPSPYSR